MATLKVGRDYRYVQAERNRDVVDVFHCKTIEFLPAMADEIGIHTQSGRELLEIYDRINLKTNLNGKPDVSADKFSICNGVILRNDRVVTPAKLRESIAPITLGALWCREN